MTIDALYSIMCRCWQSDPADCPTFQTASHELAYLLELSDAELNAQSWPDAANQFDDANDEQLEMSSAERDDARDNQYSQLFAGKASAKISCLRQFRQNDGLEIASAVR